MNEKEKLHQALSSLGKYEPDTTDSIMRFLIFRRMQSDAKLKFALKNMHLQFHTLEVMLDEISSSYKDWYDEYIDNTLNSQLEDQGEKIT